MSLATRLARMDRLAERLGGERPSPLVCVRALDPARFERLRLAAAIYMSRGLPGAPVLTDDAALLARFARARPVLRHITPNGLIMPKRETVLEYNALVRAFAEAVSSLGIDDAIGSWRIPLNLRWKDPMTSDANRGRAYATELVHSDAWAGEIPDSVTVIVPVLGDPARTGLEFFAPPAGFQETWLRPLATYGDGAVYARRYTKIDLTLRVGHAHVFDFAVLHRTVCRPGGGPRVSIDISFAPVATVHRACRPASPGHGRAMSPSMRLKGRMSHRDLLGVGEARLFVFDGSLGEWKGDAPGPRGKPRPAYRVVRLR
jgi:hypothetical protein